MCLCQPILFQTKHKTVREGGCQDLANMASGWQCSWHHHNSLVVKSTIKVSPTMVAGFSSWLWQQGRSAWHLCSLDVCKIVSQQLWSRNCFSVTFQCQNYQHVYSCWCHTLWDEDLRQYQQIRGISIQYLGGQRLKWWNFCQIAHCGKIQDGESMLGCHYIPIKGTTKVDIEVLRWAQRFVGRLGLEGFIKIEPPGIGAGQEHSIDYVVEIYQNLSTFHGSQIWLNLPQILGEALGWSCQEGIS